MGGQNRPSAEMLICLMRHSDAVFDAMLELAKRDHPSKDNSLADLRQHLVEALAVIDGLPQGLRVADASIVPLILNAMPNAAIVAIALKAAQIMRG
jgi:hypothetical protein